MPKTVALVLAGRLISAEKSRQWANRLEPAYVRAGWRWAIERMPGERWRSEFPNATEIYQTIESLRAEPNAEIGTGGLTVKTVCGIKRLYLHPKLAAALDGREEKR